MSPENVQKIKEGRTLSLSLSHTRNMINDFWGKFSGEGIIIRGGGETSTSRRCNVCTCLPIYHLYFTLIFHYFFSLYSLAFFVLCKMNVIPSTFHSPGIVLWKMKKKESWDYECCKISNPAGSKDQRQCKVMFFL